MLWRKVLVISWDHKTTNHMSLGFATILLCVLGQAMQALSPTPFICKGDSNKLSHRLRED